MKIKDNAIIFTNGKCEIKQGTDWNEGTANVAVLLSAQLCSTLDCVYFKLEMDDDTERQAAEIELLDYGTIIMGIRNTFDDKIRILIADTLMEEKDALMSAGEFVQSLKEGLEQIIDTSTPESAHDDVRAELLERIQAIEYRIEQIYTKQLVMTQLS